MGVSKRICSANKVEIRQLKTDIGRVENLRKNYPGMSDSRRMDLAVKLNELFERVDYLRRNKNNSEAYDFKYVFKKRRVQNRQL